MGSCPAEKKLVMPQALWVPLFCPLALAVVDRVSPMWLTCPVLFSPPPVSIFWCY